MNIKRSTPILLGKNIEVRKFYFKNHPVLLFTFIQKFTEIASREATTSWSLQCAKNPEMKFVHIWDCSRMTGFDTEAKSCWTESMKKYKHQTKKIFLASDNIIFRGAARLMSKMSHHELGVFKSIGEIEQSQWPD